jgi:hypothetical protein
MCKYMEPTGEFQSKQWKGKKKRAGFPALF